MEVLNKIKLACQARDPQGVPSFEWDIELCARTETDKSAFSFITFAFFRKETEKQNIPN
jgi:hypothetical protein